MKILTKREKLNFFLNWRGAGSKGKVLCLYVIVRWVCLIFCLGCDEGNIIAMAYGEEFNVKKREWGSDIIFFIIFRLLGRISWEGVKKFLGRKSKL